MTDLPDLGYNEDLRGVIVRVTDNWVVSIVPMIFNDRICLSTHDEWRSRYTAGWCYDKGAAAGLAAAVWDPELEWEPAGYIKVACDSRAPRPAPSRA